MNKIIFTYLAIFIVISGYSQNEKDKVRDLSLEFSLDYNDLLGINPSLRLGYKIKKHQFILGPTIEKYTKGGFISYQYYPYDDSQILNLYIGADISYTFINYIRNAEQQANWEKRYDEGLLTTSGVGLKLLFFNHLYFDWYMGLGYLWFHSVEDNIPMEWHYYDNEIKKNNIRIKASIGYNF